MDNTVEQTKLPISTELKAQITPESRFKKLAENTSGVLSVVEDPNVKETVPYIINYHQNEPTPEGTIRIYRGVNYVAAHACPQLPSILKTNNVDQELTNLTIELGNNPSTDIYEKIINKNEQLGNNNDRINKAKNYIKDTMEENNWNYSDAFKSMHRWENTASPYVSATSELDQAFSYAMLGLPGMVIVADVPESLITHDFSGGFDKEVSVKGPIEQKYFKSILLVEKRHNIEDQPFFESIKKLI